MSVKIKPGQLWIANAPIQIYSIGKFTPKTRGMININEIILIIKKMPHPKFLNWSDYYQILFDENLYEIRKTWFINGSLSLMQ